MTGAMNAQVSASTPILQMLAQRIMQALSTGGAGAQIPMVQRAVEAGTNTVGQTNRRTSENVARSGVGPFGRQVTEGGAEKGAFDISQISPQIIQQLLSMAPDIGMMRGSGVFGNAAGSTTTSKGSSGGGIMDLFSTGMSLAKLFG